MNATQYNVYLYQIRMSAANAIREAVAPAGDIGLADETVKAVKVLLSIHDACNNLKVKDEPK